MKLFYKENELFENQESAEYFARNFNNKRISFLIYSGEYTEFTDICEEFENDKHSFLDLYSTGSSVGAYS
jgi:hypothetical protein